MKVKIFRGLSIQKVLQDVKKNYGDRAIILSTKTVKENNVNMVEVVVAIEGEMARSNFSEPKFRSSGGLSLWRKWQTEWQEFKREIIAIFKSNMELNHIPKKYKAFLDLLEREEVLPEIIMHLYKKIKENPEIKIKNLLEFVRFEPDFLNSKSFVENKFHVFAGPSGVGKSTTLLKIVLNYKRKNPDKRVCIVNGDVFNGKKMRLKYYSELYSLDYREVKEPYQWLKVFYKKDGFDKLFIDLPSFKRGEKLYDWWNLNGLEALEENVSVYLVLSPVYSYPQIESYIRQYFHRKVIGTIWTKLDEANRFGNIINTCFYTNIPIFLLSYGPQLKNSFVSANKKRILELLLKHKLPSN